MNASSRPGATSRTRARRTHVLVAAAAVMLSLSAATPAAASTPTVSPTAVATYTGTIDGAEFRAEVPENWNGTLLLYSHHYRYLGQPNPATVVPSDVELGPRMDGNSLREILLDEGYALAGSAYASVGWAMEDALRDQPRLLSWFSGNVAAPDRTIAWGLSAGGLASVLLSQQDRRIDGALSLCADIGGVINQMNLRLDAGHVINTLLAGGTLELGRVTDPVGNDQRARAAIAAAAGGDALSRARLILAAAIADFAPQIDGHASTTVTDTYLAAQELAWLFANAHSFVTFGLGRKEIETRAGGNPLWNTGVDYRRAFARSSYQDLVRQAYAQAGADLSADLATLNGAARVAADPAAVRYMFANGGASGLALRVPVMTLHTTIDGGAPVEHERVFANRVRERGDARLLRQAFTARGFTCSFSAAEVAVTLNTLARRIDTGHWRDTSATALNEAMGAYPDRYHRVYSFLPPNPADRYAVLPPAFVDARPATLPRNPR